MATLAEKRAADNYARSQRVYAQLRAKYEYKKSKGRLTPEQEAEFLAAIRSSEGGITDDIREAGGEAEYKRIISEAPRNYNEYRLQEYYGAGGAKGFFSTTTTPKGQTTQTASVGTPVTSRPQKYMSYATTKRKRYGYEEGLGGSQVRLTILPESGFKKRREDAIKRREAETRPGIYRLSDGTVLYSQQAVGSNYVNSRGERIQVLESRVPIATNAVTGSPVFSVSKAPRAKVETAQYTPAGATDLRPLGAQYSSATFGQFSTPSGAGVTEFLTVYDVETPTQKRIAAEREVTRLKKIEDEQRKNNITPPGVLPKGAGFVSFFSPPPPYSEKVGYANVKKIGAVGVEFGEEQKRKGNKIIGEAISLTSKPYYEDPKGQSEGLVLSVAGGLVLGGISGAAVKGVTAARGVATGLKAQRYVNIGGLGLAGASGGYIYATEGKEGIYRVAPGFIAGGLAYGAAYKGVVGSPKISFLSSRSESFTFKGKAGRYAGVEESTGKVRVSFAGATETVPYQATTYYSSGLRSKPVISGGQNVFYVDRAITGTAKTTAKFYDGKITTRARYDTIINTRTGRTFVLKKNGEILSASQTVRAGAITPIDKTATIYYGRTSAGRLSVDTYTESATVLKRSGRTIKGVGNTFRTSDADIFPPQGRQPVLFEQGAALGSRAKARPIGKKGQVAVPRPDSVFNPMDFVGMGKTEVTSTPEVPSPSRSVSRFANNKISRVGSFGALPTYAPASSGGFLAFGVPGANAGASRGVLSITSAGAGVISRTQPDILSPIISRSTAKTTAQTDYTGVSSAKTGVSTVSIPITSTSSIFIPRPTGETPPPEFPPILGGVLPFAIPPSKGAGGSGKKKKRGFKYKQDITSTIFNIRGAKPAGILSGLETRPISAGRKKRK